MLKRLLAEEIERRKISVRDAAKEIGVSHSTIYAVYKDRPLEVDTAYLICKWLKVPLTTAVQVEGEEPAPDTIAAAIEVMTRNVPHLREVFSEAVEAVNSGILDPDDFRDIIEFAAYKIHKKKENLSRNEERVPGEDSEGARGRLGE